MLNRLGRGRESEVVTGQNDLDRAAGAALRELRKARGLSQEELAAEAGVDQSLLSKVERLGPVSIGWSGFCQIAEVLGQRVEVRLRPFNLGLAVGPDTLDERLKGVKHLNPTAMGWKRFCLAIGSKGIEAEVLLQPLRTGS